MRRRALALLAVALLGAPACGRGGHDGNALRLRLDGRASVTTAKGTRTLSGGSHDVDSGDRVRMLSGTGVLELPHDGKVLLRAGKHASIVRAATAPQIVDGDAVVEAAGGGGRFSAGGVDVALDEGAVRVQRRLSVTVAVYRGHATVRSAGRELAGGLDELRQISIQATGQVPRDRSPLLYDDAAPDPWDRQFLGEAIDLGRDLERRSRGLTGQLGPRVQVDAALLDRVLPPLADHDVALARVETSSPGEAVIGGAIAVESAATNDVSAAWNDVFDFRDAGARWGLVALDQRVKRDALNARLDDAAGRSPLLFAAGTRATQHPTTTRPTPPATSTPGGSGGTSTTTTTQPQPTPTSVPTPIGPITIPVPPSGGESDPAPAPTPVDIVVDLVRNLLLGEAPQ
ncbi:MAG: putative surface-exposed virulence protein [Actinomycetota bacterium]|jgi:hypothetical protein|nr:putative surface-exposed virulence protein [Actinomycetota bacterium]